MIFTGDTVRLIVNFKRFDGEAVDPTSVLLTFYNMTDLEVEQFTLDDTNRKDVGVYFYDYVVPSDKKEIIFEFKGIHNNFPIVVRDTLDIKFV